MRFQVTNFDPPEDVSDFDLLQIYNGLDTQATIEIEGKIEPQLDEVSRLIYNFEMAQLGPAIDMMFRGLLIDQEFRHLNARKAWHTMCHAERVFAEITYGMLGVSYNISSPVKVAELLYDKLYLPEQRDSKTGRRTTRVDALETLEQFPHAIYLLKCLKIHRTAAKLYQVLTTGIDADGRMRTSYNVGATETGRWSSSEGVFNTGDNLQNKTKSLREMFIADQGYKIFQRDLRQAESRGMGFLSGDLAYIAACEGGDLHTDVSAMVYTQLDWPNDPASRKRLAEEQFYRHWSRRDLSKRGGHGSNYYARPSTVAKAMQVQLQVAEEFQDSYFSAFPDIPKYHRHKAQQLGQQGFCTTPLGRRRHFLGRLNTDETLREAIAYEPQSLIVDIVDVALLRLWKNVHPLVLLQTQTHDSITGLYLEKDEEEVIEATAKAFDIDVPVTDPLGVTRTMNIPTDIQVGWNMGEWKMDKKTGEIKNPDGLKDYEGHDERTRTRPAEIHFMDWRVPTDDGKSPLS